MATVLQLNDSLNYMVDDVMPLTRAISLFNEAQDDLSEVAGYAKTSQTEFFANNPMVSLPSDLIDLVEIKIKLNRDKSYKRILPDSLVRPDDVLYADPDDWIMDNYGFEWFGTQLELRPAPPDDGNFLLRYYAQLPALLGADDIPALHPRYHRLLPLFAAARYLQNWREGKDGGYTVSGEKMDYLTEYKIGRAELEMDTSKRKSRTKSKSVYKYLRWR